MFIINFFQNENAFFILMNKNYLLKYFLNYEKIFL